MVPILCWPALCAELRVRQTARTSGRALNGLTWVKRPNETLETAMAMAHVLAQPTAAKILMKNPHRLLPEFGRQTEQHSEPLNESSGQ